MYHATLQSVDDFKALGSELAANVFAKRLRSLHARAERQGGTFYIGLKFVGFPSNLFDQSRYSRPGNRKF
jgi:hypothetical protein